ncbi:MAG: hypothetical protein U5K74_12740 [Gemmatimonadaceae bacterium]|nr:hypothetical protein [Gemmatimonadaceae bacterium]
MIDSGMDQALSRREFLVRRAAGGAARSAARGLAAGVLAALVANASASRPVAAQTLRNGHLRAQFGARGLVALTSLADSRTIRLRRDDVAITLGAQAIDSRTLPQPTTRVARDSVIYRYRAGTFLLDVIYELRPGWRFVSKQISVTALAARSFSVGDVTLFETTLAESPVSVFRPQSAKPSLGTKEYGAALRFADRHSLLMVGQNPFLQVGTRQRGIAMRYAADMEWRAGYGTFTTDRGLLAPVRLTGNSLPAEMTPEWRTVTRGSAGLDEAEVAAFTDMVRSLMLYEPAAPVHVFVGWCANDYQIDVGTPEGRSEYTRIFDQAAAVGAQYVLYAPSNSAVSRREASMDDWSWEHVLWLGLGQQIRRNEWNPRTSDIPASVQVMLDAARARKLQLLAYVYPVLPFSQNREWLVPSRTDPKRLAANLGNRALQDWLIEELVAFHAKTGIAGYSFDHTFLTYEGASLYAQWYGWRRVLEELRRRVPNIVIDGRQAHHLYGPWSYLAGSYPHPTFHDEQPESFTPYPDLHFDRVSANRERYTAYRYRNHEFTPNELVPGFMTHQTPRLDETDDMPQRMTADRGKVILPFRVRDWDLLGWRYSVLSSIAVGGWNNVINLLPARDSAEFAHFGAADRAWLRGWLEWTVANKELLRRTKQILGQPGLGKIDGAAMFDGAHGYLFLFNPDPRALTARIPLNASIGLTAAGRYRVREVSPLAGRMHASPTRDFWTRGDTLRLTLHGGSALVLEVTRVQPGAALPEIVGGTGRPQLRSDTLVIDSVVGESSDAGLLAVAVPRAARVRAVRVNGQTTPRFTRRDDVVSVAVRFGPDALAPMHPVVRWDSTFSGGTLRGEFVIPASTFEQLRARRAAWPMPWTAEEYRTTWLASERLLLWAPFSEPDDRWNASLLIDGAPVELRKAYTSIQVERSTFTGFYADISQLEPGRAHTFELTLPAVARGQFLGLYLENIAPTYLPAALVP